MTTPTTTHPGVSRALAIGAGAVTVLLTGAAFWLSFEHLHDIAAANGLPGVRAWAWPAAVDLFIIAGELLILRASLRGRVDVFAYLLAAVGSVGSIALNVAGVGSGAHPMQYVVAAVPPSAALIAFGALMRQVHTLLVSFADAAPGYAVPAAELAVPAGYPTAPESVSTEATAVSPAADPVPAPAAADEYVPDPLTEQARRVFREDFPPSVRKIRDRFSVGQARAQRIRDELTAVTA
jgi:hypothetical protein